MAIIGSAACIDGDDESSQRLDRVAADAIRVWMPSIGCVWSRRAISFTSTSTISRCSCASPTIRAAEHDQYVNGKCMGTMLDTLTDGTIPNGQIGVSAHGGDAVRAGRRRLRQPAGVRAESSNERTFLVVAWQLTQVRLKTKLKLSSCGSLTNARLPPQPERDRDDGAPVSAAGTRNRRRSGAGGSDRRQHLRRDAGRRPRQPQAGAPASPRQRSRRRSRSRAATPRSRPTRSPCCRASPA